APRTKPRGGARLSSMAASTSATWRIARFLGRGLRGTALACCVANTICNTICGLEVSGSLGQSMQPTLQEVVVTERMSIRTGTPSKGDIVVCPYPKDPTVTIGKRLVGLEGDVFLKARRSFFEASTITVPKDHCFLQGDNTKLSTDSRHFGSVPLGLVQGRVVLRVWPLERAGWLSTRWWFEKGAEKLP
ncbi:hypothetical protein PMAYCL1PPCAC_10023, partial [Pristionchus mayeri]